MAFYGKENDGAAQRPDSNRYMESLIIRLCGAYTSTQKEYGRRVERWTLVTRSYRQIRKPIVDNLRVMALTKIILFSIYNATLLQWYNKRVKVSIVLIYVDFNVTVNCHV